MHVKLTLRINEPLIEAAKQYSKIQRKSLSKLVEDYFLVLTEQASSLKMQPKDPSLHAPPLTRSLKGVLRGKKIREEDYRKYLQGKYSEDTD